MQAGVFPTPMDMDLFVMVINVLIQIIIIILISDGTDIWMDIFIPTP